MVFPKLTVIAILMRYKITKRMVYASYGDNHFFDLIAGVEQGDTLELYSMHYLDANKTAGKKARRQLHKNAASNIEQVLEATLHKAPTLRPPTSHHENYPS